MTARRLLNVWESILRDGLDEEQQADLTWRLSDPEGWAQDQNTQRIEHLIAGGGEIG